MLRRLESRPHWALLAGLLLGVSACGDLDYRAGQLRGAVDPTTPNVVWEQSTPEAEGFDAAALAELTRTLVRSGTRAFLVARHGKIVHEWYTAKLGPNHAQHVAAMTKPLAGALLFLLSVEDGRFDFDTLASEILPEWRDDARRAEIRVIQLITHNSGIENVSFPAGARGELEGWHQRYYEDLGARFRIAAFDAPVIMAPGSDYYYSGVGYYAFAYLLGRALGPKGDAIELLRKRIYAPLGIPDEAWQIGYGRRFEVDGMQLQALGSGGKFTARAIARVATLMLQRGLWNGEALLNREAFDRLYAIDGPRPVTVDRGWWVNGWELVPSLPRDALIGIGSRHQVVVAVPSLDLVAVRLGDALGPLDLAVQFQVAERHVFAPLMATVLR